MPLHPVIETLSAPEKSTLKHMIGEENFQSLESLIGRLCEFEKLPVELNKLFVLCVVALLLPAPSFNFQPDSGAVENFAATSFIDLIAAANEVAGYHQFFIELNKVGRLDAVLKKLIGQPQGEAEENTGFSLLYPSALLEALQKLAELNAMSLENIDWLIEGNEDRAYLLRSLARFELISPKNIELIKASPDIRGLYLVLFVISNVHGYRGLTQAGFELLAMQTNFEALSTFFEFSELRAIAQEAKNIEALTDPRNSCLLSGKLNCWGRVEKDGGFNFFSWFLSHYKGSLEQEKFDRFIAVARERNDLTDVMDDIFRRQFAKSSNKQVHIAVKRFGLFVDDRDRAASWRDAHSLGKEEYRQSIIARLRRPGF